MTEPVLTPRRLLSLTGMLAIGALLAVQSEVNGELAIRLGSGVRASTAAGLISFGTGLLFLSTLVALEPRSRRGLLRIGAAARSGELRWWQLVGGFAGAFLVVSQGLAVDTIGVALFTVALVAGLSTSSLLVDHVGLGPAGRQAVSTVRVGGAVMTVAAVLLTVTERLGGADALGLAALTLALLPMTAGCGTAYQQAVNGQVYQVGGPWATTWNNFVVGTTLLLVLMLASLAVPGDLRTPPTTWWLYSGGLMGMVFICAAAMLVQVHGVLILGLCTVAGQVICAVGIDALADEAHVGILSVVGATLTLTGVALASSSGLRRLRGQPFPAG